MSGLIVAPETRDLDRFAGQLEAWLRQRMPAASDLDIHNLNYPRGAGLSHETILFDVAWTEQGAPKTRGMVARIKPTRHFVFPDNLFDEQYQLMRHLHADGRVRVAEPFWIEQDASILGAPFFVMAKVRGRVPVSSPPYRDVGWVAEATPEQRATMWENGVRQLAAVQAVSRQGLDFLRGATPGAEEGLAQEWDKYRRFIAWAADDTFRPILSAGMDRLERSWPKNQPAGLVWGDARLGNMMFDEAFEVVAVMDWEQPSLGGALHDLAWWLVLSELWHSASPTRPYLHGMGTRAETIALWQSITGISADDIEWYEEFVQLKMSCCSLRTAAIGRYPAPKPEVMAKRLKVAA